MYVAERTSARQTGRPKHKPENEYYAPSVQCAFANRSDLHSPLRVQPELRTSNLHAKNSPGKDEASRRSRRKEIVATSAAASFQRTFRFPDPKGSKILAGG